MVSMRVVWLLVLINLLGNLGRGVPQLLAPDEVGALEEIAERLKRPPWNLSADPCSSGDPSWVAPPNKNAEANSSVTCRCAAPGSTCHVTEMYYLPTQSYHAYMNGVLAKWNLAGVLPQLSGLPNLWNL
ncbi:hypothetical protein ACLOJK_008667 [Asimina triloba]